MQLSEDRPDYEFALRAADGHHAKVNERVLARSLVRLEQDALVLSADGRVIASSTADWSVGELASHFLANANDGCSVLKLS